MKSITKPIAMLLITLGLAMACTEQEEINPKTSDIEIQQAPGKNGTSSGGVNDPVL